PPPAVRRRRAPRLHVPTRPRAVRAGQDARAPNERRPQEQCVARQRHAAPTDRLPPPEHYERSRTTAAGCPPSPRDRQRRTDHLPDRRQAHDPCPRSLWPTTAREPASQRQARTEARPAAGAPHRAPPGGRSPPPPEQGPPSCGPCSSATAACPHRTNAGRRYTAAPATTRRGSHTASTVHAQRRTASHAQTGHPLGALPSPSPRARAPARPKTPPRPATLAVCRGWRFSAPARTTGPRRP